LRRQLLTNRAGIGRAKNDINLKILIDMTNGENESEDSDYVLVGQSEEPKKEVPKGPESLKDNVSVCFVFYSY